MLRGHCDVIRWMIVLILVCMQRDETHIGRPTPWSQLKYPRGSIWSSWGVIIILYGKPCYRERLGNLPAMLERPLKSSVVTLSGCGWIELLHQQKRRAQEPILIKLDVWVDTSITHVVCHQRMRIYISFAFGLSYMSFYVRGSGM